MDALKRIVTFDKLVNADHWSSVRSSAHTHMSRNILMDTVDPRRILSVYFKKCS